MNSRTVNRVGTEEPWTEQMGNFYGSSYFTNPCGETEAQASADQDELLIHDIDMNKVREVRNTWQFYRDRPDIYTALTKRCRLRWNHLSSA